MVGQRRPGVPGKKVNPLRRAGTSLPYLMALALILLNMLLHEKFFDGASAVTVRFGFYSTSLQEAEP